MKSPTPAQLTEARTLASLTQAQAAAFALTTARTWARWEQGKTQMHPAIWAYFLLRTGTHPSRVMAPRAQ